ncbi:hypothetical protein P7K49_002369, partial [Saguinus oedipus]
QLPTSIFCKLCARLANPKSHYGAESQEQKLPTQQKIQECISQEALRKRYT